MTRTTVQLSLERLIAISWVSGIFGGLFVWGVSQPGFSGPGRASRQAITRQVGASPVPQGPQVEAPWGDLEVFDIEIDRPPEYSAFDIDPEPPRWVFEGASLPQVRGWLEEAGMPAGQIERALSAEMSRLDDTGVVLQPDADLILSLSPEGRARLYKVLGQWATNLHMQYPLRTRPGDLRRWLGAEDVDPEVAETVLNLVYRQGDAECFSDHEMILRSIGSAQERLNLGRILSRQHALLLRLRIHPDTDIERFLGYWSVKGVRHKDLRPLAEALKRLPTGGTMSVTHAMPLFARERLYTFPTPNLAGSVAEDCHWSTLNFFNDPPDDRLRDVSFTSSYLQENFYLISTATQYGDRVFFFDAKGNAIHSAVYVAADIVFTKNGAGPTQPWVLMRIKDLLDTYGGNERVSMLFYREKSA